MEYTLGNNGSFEFQGEYPVHGTTFWIKIEWQEYQDIVNNRSYISVKAYLYSDTWSGNWFVSGNITTNGSELVSMSYMGATRTHKAEDVYGRYALIDNKGSNLTTPGAPAPWESVWINHNSDGNANVTIDLNNISVWSGTWGDSSTNDVIATLGDFSKNIELKKIPREAKITFVPVSFNDEDNPTIYYSNPTGNIITDLAACISWSGSPDIAYRELDKKGTSYQFNLTSAERSSIRKACIEKSMPVTFYLRTVIEDQVYYNTASSTLNIINADPVIKYEIKDTNSTSTDLTGNNQVIINGVSNLSISMVTTAKKQATISRNSILVNGYWNEGQTSLVVNGATDGYIQFWTQDSRGFEKYETKQLEVIPYFLPTITVSGNAILADDNTTTIHLKLTGNIFVGSFGIKNNTCKVQYRYGSTDSPWSDWFVADAFISNTTFLAETDVVGLDYYKDYEIEAWVGDSLNECYGKKIVISTKPIFQWGRNNFDVNVPFSCPNNFDVIPDTQGMVGDYGYIWSKYGDTYNKFYGDNYYIAVTPGPKIWTGEQLNGQNEITWIDQTSMDKIVAYEPAVGSGWGYRKWDSGIAECWFSSDNVVDVVDPFGSGYYGPTDQRFYYQFPFPFIEPPEENVNISGDLIVCGGFPLVTAEYTGCYYAYSPTQNGGAVLKYNYYAIGRWK